MPKTTDNNLTPKVHKTANMKRYRREQFRRLYGKRSDGLLTRKYTPEQWNKAIELYESDKSLSIASVARAVGMSYKMTWKILREPFSFGRIGSRKRIAGYE